MRIIEIRYITGLIIAAIMTGGCESLDYVPGDQMSGQTFWQTEEHARQAAVGMYAAMRADHRFNNEVQKNLVLNSPIFLRLET